MPTTKIVAPLLSEIATPESFGAKSAVLASNTILSSGWLGAAPTVVVCLDVADLSCVVCENQPAATCRCGEG
jgi:hypothetical protein